MPKSFIFYEGPSMLDGAPIVAIATIGSSNKKTGDMVSTWIIRSDKSPIDASRDGSDAAICGDCPHRGQHDENGARIASTRTCYVRLDTAPLGVFKAYQRGSYDNLNHNLNEARARVAGRMVRLGAYGDPAAVPFGAWFELLRDTKAHVGYTHQWRMFPEFAQWTMASCDNETDRTHAKALGFRTFRVAAVTDWQAGEREVLCPASEEAGRKVTCAACKACGGTTAKARVDIVIPAHGASKKRVAG